MIQLFASDLDGTLLNENHTTDETILSGIDQILNADKHFAISTGRDMHSQQHTLIDFGNRSIFTICMNGALIFDHHRHVLFSKPIHPELIYSFCKEFEALPMDYTGLEYKYTTAARQTILNRYRKRLFWGGIMDEKKIDTFTSDYIYKQTPEQIASHVIYKINGFAQDKETYKRIQLFLDRHADCLINAPYRPDFFEITDKSVNKGSGVKRLADHLSIAYDKIAVYGDSGNDVEMMKQFKHAYAPLNAAQIVKDHALEVLGESNEYSVVKHMISLL